MKVALFVPGGVDRSGRQRVIPALLALIHELSRRHQVTVFATRQYTEFCRYRLAGAEVINLGSVRKLGPLGSLPQLMNRVLRLTHREQRSWDLLHAFWVGSTSNLALALAGLWRVPVIVSIGGGEPVWIPEIGYGGVGTLRGRLSLALAKRLADCITVGSRFLKARIGDVDAHIIPLGIDTGFWSARATPEPGPPWRLVHVGSLNRVKDPDTLLAVAVHLARNGLRFRLDWIGVDTLQGKVQARARALGLERFVHFHGFLEQEKLIGVLRKAHLYVQTSHYESQGVAICEAAALGIPVVGTGVGLVSDWAPAAALATPVGNAESLAVDILNLLSTPEERRRLGAAGQEWVLSHGSDWSATRFHELYEQFYG